MAGSKTSNAEVLARFEQLYSDLFSHDGYADMRVEMKILRKGQKEVIIHCGRQFRFVVDFNNESEGQPAGTAVK